MSVMIFISLVSVGPGLTGSSCITKPPKKWPVIQKWCL